MFVFDPFLSLNGSVLPEVWRSDQLYLLVFALYRIRLEMEFGEGNRELGDKFARTAMQRARNAQDRWVCS